MPDLVIREATAKDARCIYDFIVELAAFEKAEHEVLTSPEELRVTLFGPQSKACALICELDGRSIGYAIYYFTFSTWLGKQGIYLEDLYVQPEQRGVGAGKALFRQVAKIGVANHCGRYEWAVLGWNSDAIDFYEAMGAEAQDEWTIYRLHGDALKNFAANE